MSRLEPVVPDVGAGVIAAEPERLEVSEPNYERLATLRDGLRGYFAWAEEEAKRHDTTPMQFQLMLATRSLTAVDGPTVSELAQTLRLRHHSVVGLIDRAELVGLVRRTRDAGNGSRVRVSLTPSGARRLAALTHRHELYLSTTGSTMTQLWGAFVDPNRASETNGEDPRER